MTILVKRSVRIANLRDDRDFRALAPRLALPVI
jgi:hypothetical protein